MMRFNRWILIGAAVAPLTCSGVLALAQQNGAAQQQREGHQQQQTGRQGQQQQQQKAMAGWVVLDNAKVIEVAKIAQTKAQNQKVKQLAQSMAKDYRTLNQQLLKAARQGSGDGQQGVAGGAEQGQGGQQDPAQQDGSPQDINQIMAQVRGMTHQMGSAGHLLAMKIRVCRQQFQQAKQQLQQTQQQNFDNSFLYRQIMSHHDMLATLAVVQEQMQGRATQAIQQATRKYEQNLQQMQQLIKQVRSQRQTEQKQGGQS